MNEARDARLMALTRAGDREAFGRLVEHHKDTLVSYLTRVTGCRERAEDVAQESFVRLYRARDRYREQGRFAGYLFRIALNQVRQEERRARRWRLVQASLAAVPGAGIAAPLAPGRLLRDEMQRRLVDALARLPLRYRAPVVLHDVQGWSYQSIAEALDCRLGTVKSRINRGRRQLRRWLTPHLGGDGRQEGRTHAARSAV